MRKTILMDMILLSLFSFIAIVFFVWLNLFGEIVNFPIPLTIVLVIGFTFFPIMTLSLIIYDANRYRIGGID